MPDQLTTDEQALRLFFTDDIYLVPEPKMPDIAQDHTEIASAPLAAAEQQMQAFKFLGQNKRNILILVNDQENEVSDEKGRELLRKIVKSVNLSAVDFALLNYAGYEGTRFSDLQKQFSAVIVLAFGVSPAHLGLPGYPENTVVEKGGIKVIFSAELRKLDEDQLAKKVLWGSLKQLGI